MLIEHQNIPQIHPMMPQWSLSTSPAISPIARTRLCASSPLEPNATGIEDAWGIASMCWAFRPCVPWRLQSVVSTALLTICCEPFWRNLPFRADSCFCCEILAIFLAIPHWEICTLKMIFSMCEVSGWSFFLATNPKMAGFQEGMMDGHVRNVDPSPGISSLYLASGLLSPSSWVLPGIDHDRERKGQCDPNTW